MKRTTFFLALIILSTSLVAQDIVERISNEMCNCIDTIENMDSLNARIDRCLPEALDLVWNSAEDNDNSDDAFAATDTVENTVKAVMQQLAVYCPKIKKFILADEESKYYKMSESAKAREYYEAGNKAFEDKDYKEAGKQFQKAVKEDHEWVYALDNLGLTYRYLEDYKKAVSWYAKSLDVYPYGSFALQNQAVAYICLNKFDDALGNYTKLINLYTDNPEGYYGKARVYFLSDNYDLALTYACYTHNMYVAAGSEYKKDTEQLINLIHDKMKAQNTLDKFNELTKKYGINFTE
jgi:tetratricopeptide (TPR) repeat protein